jgi:UDP-N-acetylmuramate dehydrogenase
VAPRSREDLLALLGAARAEGIPCFILGGGANLLVGDKGIRGLVVETRLLNSIEPARDEGGYLLVAEAGLAIDQLCEFALGFGLAGLETFYGMPGSVGGAVFMNARCYEIEMADRLAWTEGIAIASLAGEAGDARPASGAPEPQVVRHDMNREEWAYKRSPFQGGGSLEGEVVLAAAFRLALGDRGTIERTMAEKRHDREAKGHYRLPSAGSVFKNDRSLGRPTGKILDELGLRGRRVGGAMVSEWHANIFVNSGAATAADMRALIELAQREAQERLGVGLEPEVLFAGEF